MTTTAPVAAAAAHQAALPLPRGPLSEAVIEALRSGGPATAFALTEAHEVDPYGDEVDPYGDDLQLALYVCYELHYQGFADVVPEWEWDPELLRLRGVLERTFLGAMRIDVQSGTNVPAALDDLLVEPVDGSGVSHYLRDSGEWWQVREYLVHRSIYHLKEADPHAWVIPRLRGQAKASLVAVEFDEFGSGHGERMHSRLYADLLTGAGLDARYLGYLDQVPAPILTAVNLMSLFGLHRALRGSLVGHLAATEISTGPSAYRMAKALERFDADPSCIRFYTEHIEADAVHEQVMRHDVVGDLLNQEPDLAESVVFGVRATEFVEQRLAEHLLDSWRRGQTSLRYPLS